MSAQFQTVYHNIIKITQCYLHRCYTIVAKNTVYLQKNMVKIHFPFYELNLNIKYLKVRIFGLSKYSFRTSPKLTIQKLSVTFSFVGFMVLVISIFTSMFRKLVRDSISLSNFSNFKFSHLSLILFSQQGHLKKHSSFYYYALEQHWHSPQDL